MKTDRPGGRPPKPREPDYTWGETPAGVPELVWEHAARPLWAQVFPERDAILLMEKERHSLRQASTGKQWWEGEAAELPDHMAYDESGAVLAAGSNLRELDLADGRQRWRQRPGGTVTALALDAETVYAATQGPLFALERASGKQRWRTPCSWEPELHPVPEAGLLLVDDPETETVLAFETKCGSKRWEFAAEGQPLVPGPLRAGLVPISAHAAGVAAVEPETGEVRWRLESDRSEGAFESPAIAWGDLLFLTDGTIYAVDPATGAVRWRRALEREDDRVFSLRLSADTLFAETWRGALIALEPGDGSLRWERMLGETHGLVADERRVYVRANTARPDERWAVLALDRTTGDLAWEMQTRRMVSDLTRVGGVLLVELRGSVVALKA